MANPFIQQASPMMAQSPQYAPQMMDIQRQQKLAEMLQEQALKQEQGQMVSGHYIRPSMLGGLAKVAGAYLSGKMQNDVAEKQAELLRQQQEGVSNWLSSMPKDQPGLQPQQLPPDVAGPPLTEAIPGKPVSREDKMAWLLRGAQVAPQLAGPMLQTELDDKPIVLGKSLVNKRGDVIGMDATWKEDQAAQREQRMAELKQRSEDARALQAERLQAQRELRILMGSMANANKPTKWQTIQTPQGMARVNPETGEVQPLTMGGQQIGTPKSQAREQQDIQSSISAQQALDQAALLFNHPGRSMGTGITNMSSMIPGTDARGFKANLDTFKAQTFVPMVSALKGMGALSDAEGKKLTDSVGALDPSMSTKEFESSLKLVTKNLYDKAKAAGLNVSIPEFAAESAPAAKIPSIDAIEAEIRRRKGGR